MNNRWSGVVRIIVGVAVLVPFLSRPGEIPDGARGAGEIAAIVVAAALVVTGLYKVYKGGSD